MIDLKKISKSILERGNFPGKIDNLLTTGKWIGMTNEIILSLFHPNIFSHQLSFTTNSTFYNRELTYYVNDFLSFAMLFRFYIFFRFFICYSKYYDARSNRVGFEFN